MSWTQADIDAMDEAIKRGVISVTLPSGESISYATMTDLIKARALAVQEVSQANATAANQSTRYSLARFV